MSERYMISVYLIGFFLKYAGYLPSVESTGSWQWPSRTGRPRCPWKSPEAGAETPGRPPGWPTTPKTRSLPHGDSCTQSPEKLLFLTPSGCNSFILLPSRYEGFFEINWLICHKKKKAINYHFFSLRQRFFPPVQQSQKSQSIVSNPQPLSRQHPKPVVLLRLGFLLNHQSVLMGFLEGFVIEIKLKKKKGKKLVLN